MPEKVSSVTWRKSEEIGVSWLEWLENTEGQALAKENQAGGKRGNAGGKLLSVLSFISKS